MQDRVAFDVYQPLVFGAAAAQQQGRVLTVFARIAPTLTIDAARADLASVAASFNETRGPAGSPSHRATPTTTALGGTVMFNHPLTNAQLVADRRRELERLAEHTHLRREARRQRKRR